MLFMLLQLQFWAAVSVLLPCVQNFYVPFLSLLFAFLDRVHLAVSHLSDFLFGNAITDVPASCLTESQRLFHFLISFLCRVLVLYIIWIEFMPSLHITVLVCKLGPFFMIPWFLP